MNIKVLVVLLFSASICVGSEEKKHEAEDYDMFDYKTHPCRRNCKESKESKTCHYTFVVERYTTMSKACYDCPNTISDCFRPHCVAADGVEKMIYTINRQMPGPIIEVCQYDDILVEVRNKMSSESTTLHWHGYKHLHNSNSMDGVPYLTQCPIMAGQYSIYRFLASQVGTFFYRGHIGTQRADGLFGAMIVRNATESASFENLDVYDEHIVMLNDWSHRTAEESIMMDLHNGKPLQIDTLLVNGLGRREFSGPKYNKTTPTDVFTVREGKNYRFRVIAAGVGSCPIRMTIDQHVMKVISLDSNYIKSELVDAITIWPGERIDFIMNAHRKTGNYWIRFAGDRDCKSNGHHLAVLRYDTVGLSTPEGSQDPRQIVSDRSPKTILNAYHDPNDEEIPDTMNIHYDLIRSLVPMSEEVEHGHNTKLIIPIDMYPLDNHDYHRKNLYGYTQVPFEKRSLTPQMSYTSMQMPYEPLLMQGAEVNTSTFCQKPYPWDRDCEGKHCQCTRVLKLSLNKTVDVVLINEGGQSDVNHTLYLHGHFFRVIESKSLEGMVTVKQVLEMIGNGPNFLEKNLPLKDTVTVPSNGYSIIRFYTDNPGYWLFHSQVEPHNVLGMAVIFQVGEYSDMRVLKGLPTCQLTFYKNK